MAVACAARDQLGLERVLLVPTAHAPHKVLECDPGRLRLEMVEAAISGQPALEVCAVEFERPGPSYTYQTLAEIAHLHPDAELYLIMGYDQAAALERWKHPERLLRLARLAVARRPGTDPAAVHATLRRLGAADQAVFFSNAEDPVSSTQVRERLRRGEEVEELVPEAVAQIIHAHRLYR